MRPLLHIEDLRIERHTPHGLEPIVSSFSLTVRKGQTVGIVGESGSGKSMTARAIVRLLPPTLAASGGVWLRDRDLTRATEREWRHIRGREIGLVLQDPFTMLNPVVRCGKTIEESLLPLPRRRSSRTWRREETIRRLQEVGIDDETVAARYPFQLSGGMRQRVAIAAALARDPELLIADEPSTALDATTQREILRLLRRIQQRRGMGLVLITHDLRVAFSMCDDICVLYAGSIAERAPSKKVMAQPLHPYTQALLLSEPPLKERLVQLPTIPGSVPSAAEVATQCAFASRCKWVTAACTAEKPGLVQLDSDRASACIRVEAIRAALTSATPTATVSPRLEKRRRAVAGRPPLITANGLTKVFRTGKRPVTALENVSIEILENESVGIVGESGSGKTTLSRILVGLETPVAGDIVVDGVNATDWRSLSAGQLRQLRRTVQIVFQDPYSSLNPMRTVGAALREAITTHRPDTQQAATEVAALLELVGLPPAYARRKPAALSGGERQRVAIARALAARPRLLICDEPVSALDVSVQAQILNLFASIRREHGLGFLFITHDLSIVRQVVDRIYVMHRGKIIEAGAVDEILDNPQTAYTAQLIAAVPQPGSNWLSENPALHASA